jgi:tetratricopeptide (TPR) repeat protein
MRPSRLRARLRALRRIAALGLWILGAAAPVWASVQSELPQALSLYQQGKYREALRLLEPMEPKSAPAYALLGQTYYMLDDYKKASEALEKATEAAPEDSMYWDWLGRANGRRAETAFPLMAPAYARRARQNFEKAVELDPKNLEAVDDLFEYYLQAPGMLGGGEDKAARLSETIQDVAPARYHGMQARLAEKNKQFDEAEAHWRKAVQAAPDQLGRHIDLARFLARQGKATESDAAFQEAAKIAPNSAALKFNRARAYIDSGRNTDQAKQLLHEYLSLPLTPDDPPRSEAEDLLKKL